MWKLSHDSINDTPMIIDELDRPIIFHEGDDIAVLQSIVDAHNGTGNQEKTRLMRELVEVMDRRKWTIAWTSSRWQLCFAHGAPKVSEGEVLFDQTPFKAWMQLIDLDRRQNDFDNHPHKWDSVMGLCTECRYRKRFSEEKLDGWNKPCPGRCECWVCHEPARDEDLGYWKLKPKDKLLLMVCKTCAAQKMLEESIVNQEPAEEPEDTPF